jgi:hypothetical protein
MLPVGLHSCPHARAAIIVGGGEDIDFIGSGGVFARVSMGVVVSVVVGVVVSVVVVEGVEVCFLFGVPGRLARKLDLKGLLEKKGEERRDILLASSLYLLRRVYSGPLQLPAKGNNFHKICEFRLCVISYELFVWI